MPWMKSISADAAVTRASIGGREFVGHQGHDGRYYFDIPSDLVAAATGVGLAPSSPPPAEPGPPLWFDADKLADKVADKVEARLARSLSKDAARKAEGTG